MASLEQDGNFSNGEILWKSSTPETSRMFEFLQCINKEYSLSLHMYNDLYRWSIRNIAQFWASVWTFTGIRYSEPYTQVVNEDAPMFPRPAFFEGAKLNFAENLLFPTCNVSEDSLAVIAVTEETLENVSWKEMRLRVRDCTASMRAAGIKERMVVAGYLANHTNALVAMLSATSIGAVWSGISPDTGVQAVLERLEQIEPTLLFADNAVTYNGKQHDVQQKLAEITKALRHLRAVVVFDTVKGIDTDVQSLNVPQGRAWTYQAFLDLSSSTSSGSEFAQLQPDHPVYVLYSSGTTGKPKCIVHGAIGTLIQHKKEHDLHCDIHSGDRLFYFTTCTWMMWHWLVSGLAVGATIILYDGSPFRTTPDPAARSSSSSSSNPGELAMPKLINDLAITHFGTSAKYLSVLEQKGTMPRPTYPMTSLRAVYSTGSPLAPSTFRYVYRAFGPEINLGSITGGTDIISLFGAPCPLVPVYAGEVQCRGLGMAVEAWDADGKDVSSTGETGDLVCARAFPCQPVGFWGIDGTARYESSYFTRFPGVWHHGDFVRINPRTGGLVMLGRSDGILKPAGVRFGSAEIYNCLLRAFPTEVTDALCVGRRRAQDSDETVVLFLKIADGHTFSDELSKSIKAEIRRSLSARHVPGIVDECFDIPVTTNGKKVEAAVKQILSGSDIKTSASVANAECLNWYRTWADVHS